MPNLQRQMEVLVYALPDVGNFSILLMLFTFMFAILGMFLFGARLKEDVDPTCTSNCTQTDARSNFNNLYWSFITVFQILTIERFYDIMENAVRATGLAAPMYFITLVRPHPAASPSPNADPHTTPADHYWNLHLVQSGGRHPPGGL